MHSRGFGVFSPTRVPSLRSHSPSCTVTLHAFLRPMPHRLSAPDRHEGDMLYHAALPRNPPSKHLVSAYLALKLGITSPRLLQCIRDPSQTQLCCGISTLGGTRRTRMKESHEVQEIRQGTSDDRHLCWRRRRHLVLRAKLFGWLSLRHRDSDRLNHGSGVISGFKIDHNTGNLVPIAGLPVSSGGANPARAVLLTGGRFVYVLNRGTTADGGPCSATDVCSNANITQFSIGGNGVLAPQGTYYTQGNNPFRMIADCLRRTHLCVLDHDAPDGTGCSLVFGPAVTTCGDITAFSVDSTTGRLSYVLNSQVTAASGAPLPYFPVPANPIDFTLSSNFFLTLSGTPATGDSVFPYAYNVANGQLTINQNSSQPLGISQGTAIVVAGGVTYVLDNGPNTNSPTNGQIFAYSRSAQMERCRPRPTDILPTTRAILLPELRDRVKQRQVALRAEPGRQYQHHQRAERHCGILRSPTRTSSTPIAGQGQTVNSTPGTGAGPQCILEDPSNQFIYTANFNSSTVTGLSIDQNAGILTPLSQQTKAKDSYALPGPATWCVATGRTS